MLRSRLVLALLLLAPFAGAQVGQGAEVGVTGVVVPLPGPIGCGPATHMLSCTKVFLEGDVALLNSLIGKNVKLLGKEVPLPALFCTLIDVEAAVDPPATLDWCGSPVPGCDLRFVICPGGLSQWWLWASPAQGWHALSPLKGAWLLGDPAFLLAMGLGTAACDKLDVKVPADPSLIGVTVYLQGARRDIGPVGPIQLTNAICVTILPSTMPCVPPGC
jgi:hypothetical protein